MRRRLPLACLIALAVGAALTTALALGAVTVPPSRAYLERFACHKALGKRQRLVSVTAVMRPLPSTIALRIRFQLESLSSAGTQEVLGGDLGAWLSPTPSTLGQNPNDVWIVNKPVSGVAVPGTYRFRVSFRWIGSDGRTLGETERVSNSCYQPDLRADLLVRSINVKPVAGNAAENRYIAVIANDGMTAAKNVQVVFAPSGGFPDQTARIAKLPPHSSRTRVFVGPACTAADEPTVTVDPEHPADDLNLSNNSLSATCPPPATGTQPPSTSTTPAAGGT